MVAITIDFETLYWLATIILAVISLWDRFKKE